MVASFFVWVLWAELSCLSIGIRVLSLCVPQAADVCLASPDPLPQTSASAECGAPLHTYVLPSHSCLSMGVKASPVPSHHLGYGAEAKQRQWLSNPKESATEEKQELCGEASSSPLCIYLPLSPREPSVTESQVPPAEIHLPAHSKSVLSHRPRSQKAPPVVTVPLPGTTAKSICHPLDLVSSFTLGRLATSEDNIQILPIFSGTMFPTTQSI